MESKLKPKIYKQDGRWFLSYHFPVRSFWVFGMNNAEREELKARCQATIPISSWESGIHKLRWLYSSHEIRLY